MLILTFLLCIYIFISAFSYVNLVSYDLRNSVLRLHVVANSNSKEDQELKYIVRDNLIQYMNSLCQNCKTKDDTIEVVSNHISDFNNIANTTIAKNGFDYNATVELGNFEFPTKNYGDISFPAGYYDALKVNLGKADGQNWWCVLYPSLCFVNITSGVVPEDSKDNLKDSLSYEEYQLISNQESPCFSYKFKLVELFNKYNIISAKL